MKYLIIGAGGTGGPLGAYMIEAGFDVTFIARGHHLEAIRENGLTMETTSKGIYTLEHVRAFTMEEYEAEVQDEMPEESQKRIQEGSQAASGLCSRPDVIFVCVKGYSLDERLITFIRNICHKETVVIPILNIYGTGGKMQEALPELLVTDGCIYIAAEIKKPGVLWMNGDIFRVVFGVRKPEEYRQVLEQVKKDLDASGILGILSDNIRRDALKKFSYVSPAAACGIYFGDAKAGDMQKPGEIRNLFAGLIAEIEKLASAMDIDFGEDMVAVNLAILDNLTPFASTSMQRDIAAGKNSEIDGLIFEVVRLGDKYQVDLPLYRMVAEEMKKRGF